MNKRVSHLNNNPAYTSYINDIKSVQIRQCEF